MFSWQHILWLIICLVSIIISVLYCKKNNVSLTKVLNVACAICIYSETSKVFSTIQMVSSQDGSIIRPYIPLNHLPLHLCSLQILLIFYVRFTENKKMRERLLAFMYPSCIIGALSALLMPSIFTTSISVDQAFTHPISYQFFIFHTMLIVLGICIGLSNEIKWERKHIYSAILITLLLGFISIYINSIFASPTYLNGKLLYVDFWPNFMFTYDDPIGLNITTLNQWFIYLAVLVLLVIVLVTLFFLPVIKKNK